jgi:hypothetical protein
MGFGHLAILHLFVVYLLDNCDLSVRCIGSLVGTLVSLLRIRQPPGPDARLGIWLGGAALALGVYRFSFVASSSSLLQICCPSLMIPLLIRSRLASNTSALVTVNRTLNATL